MEDDIYKDRFIPGGSMIIPNIWFADTPFSLFLSSFIDIDSKGNDARRTVLPRPAYVQPRSLRLQGLLTRQGRACALP